MSQIRDKGGGIWHCQTGSAGFILSCCEGHELSKDKQIQVCANEVKSCSTELASQVRTAAAGVLQNAI